jgi:C4-dicarboxylate transporter
MIDIYCDTSQLKIINFIVNLRLKVELCTIIDIYTFHALIFKKKKLNKGICALYIAVFKGVDQAVFQRNLQVALKRHESYPEVNF